MQTVFIAFLASMIQGGMLAPNQPRPNGLPMLYRCEVYAHATIDPQTFEMTVRDNFRNCVAIREMTFPEYFDWRDAQKK